MKAMYNLYLTSFFILFSLHTYSQCLAPTAAAFEACANNPATTIINVTDTYDVTANLDLSDITIDLDNNEEVVFAGTIIVNAGTNFTGGGRAVIETQGIKASSAAGQGTGGLTLSDVNTAMDNGATTLLEAMQGACQANPSCASTCMADATCNLPVEMLYFKGKNTAEHTNLLTWATASEQNNAYFEVQRSIDGKVLDAMEKIEGAGTTLSAQTYTWLDNKIYKQTYYYRLKQVDLDVQYEYTEIIAVRSKTKLDKNTLIISPNPARDQLNYQVNDLKSIESIYIFDMHGRIILTSRDTSNSIYIEELPRGIYVLQLNTNRESIRRKFVKQ